MNSGFSCACVSPLSVALFALLLNDVFISSQVSSKSNKILFDISTGINIFFVFFTLTCFFGDYTLGDYEIFYSYARRFGVRANACSQIVVMRIYVQSQ